MPHHETGLRVLLGPHWNGSVSVRVISCEEPKAAAVLLTSEITETSSRLFGWDGQLDIAWTRTLKPGTFTVAAARIRGRGYHNHKAADW